METWECRERKELRISVNFSFWNNRCRDLEGDLVCPVKDTVILTRSTPSPSDLKFL